MATILCSKCGQQIEEHAAFCTHCGAKQTKEGSEETPTNETSSIAPAANYGVILLAIPIIAAVVLLAGTAGVAGFELSANGVTGIMLAAILATAVVASIEASKVGMKMDRSKGTYGPVVWFIVMALLWIIAYPVYMFKRKHFGLPNRLIAALVVAFVFVLSPAIIDLASGTTMEAAGDAALVSSTGNQEAVEQQQGSASSGFRCADYPELVQTADLTIRHVEEVKDLDEQTKKLIGPDIQHWDSFSQRIPDNFKGICIARAYYYDNTDREILYSVSTVNNDAEWFVAVQDIGSFNQGVMWAEIKHEKEEKERAARQSETQASQEQAPVIAEQVSTSYATADEPVQPSFDCNNATIKVERLICENPELARWDVTVNESYKQITKVTNASEINALVNAQKQWIKSRNQCESTKCIADAYQHRHEELEPWEYEQHE